MSYNSQNFYDAFSKRKYMFDYTRNINSISNTFIFNDINSSIEIKNITSNSQSLKHNSISNIFDTQTQFMFSSNFSSSNRRKRRTQFSSKKIEKQTYNERIQNLRTKMIRLQREKKEKKNATKNKTFQNLICRT